MDAQHRRLTRGLIVVVMIGFAIIGAAAFFAPPLDEPTGLRGGAEFWGLYVLLGAAIVGVAVLFFHLIPKEEREGQQEKGGRGNG